MVKRFFLLAALCSLSASAAPAPVKIGYPAGQGAAAGAKK
jgi:hypothetical protein